MSGPKRGSGQRSGLFSEEKFTNRTLLDPVYSEIQSVKLSRAPDDIVRLSSGQVIKIFAARLSDSFVLPCSATDVSAALRAIPEEYLTGLARIVLLGGNAKQKKARQLRFGTYDFPNIYLHPIPESRLQMIWCRPPKPSTSHQYTKFGAKFSQDGSRVKLVFSLKSLQLFYLYDVLLHEIGHHVESRDGRKSPAESERYAQWFAEYQQAQKSGTPLNFTLCLNENK